jgi:glycosyltransferase involved in cell wall biosynthesis
MGTYKIKKLTRKGFYKMKVVHLSSVHPRYDTRIFIKECTSLVHAGIEVYFVVADGMGDEEKNGVHIIDAGPRKQSRLLRMIQTVQKVFNKACKIDADYFHLHDPELLPLVPFLKKRGRIIYDMHENVPKQILTKKWIPKIFRSLISKMFQFLEKLFLRNTHVIFAELSYAKDYSWLKNTTTILNMPLVSNLETIAKKVSKYSHFSLGYIGGVSPVRGSIIILEALRILKSRHVSFFFECVGPISNSHEKELLAFLKNII